MRTKNNGFTLIELLAGITVLTVMVLFLTRLFTDTSAAWAQGTKRVESNLTGRTAVEYISRLLASAIVDDTLSIRLFSNENSDLENSLGYSSDKLYFVTSDQKAQISDSGNLYRQVKYVGLKVSRMNNPAGGPDPVHRYRIMQGVLERFNDSAATDGIYLNPDWYNYIESNLGIFNQVIVENVRSLDFWVYDQDGDNITNFDSTRDQDNDGKLDRPSYIDVVVEIIPDSDSIRIEEIPDRDARIEYADRVSRRYFNRIYLNHFQGYTLSQIP